MNHSHGLCNATQLAAHQTASADGCVDALHKGISSELFQFKSGVYVLYQTLEHSLKLQTIAGWLWRRHLLVLFLRASIMGVELVSNLSASIFDTLALGWLMHFSCSHQKYKLIINFE